MHSPEAPWKDNVPTRGRPARGFAPDLPRILHCRTGLRGLKSMAEELGRYDLSAGETASQFYGEALRDLVPLRPLCGPATHRVAKLRLFAHTRRQDR